MNKRVAILFVSVLLIFGGVLWIGCDALPAAYAVPTVVGLTADEVATLNSLTLVDGFPLYTMVYSGEYEFAAAESFANAAEAPQWDCSLFTTLLPGESMLFGRNFDWQYSPALLLFTDPPDGFASVSVVDIAYLVSEETARDLVSSPLEERIALLRAPLWTFDGMNEHGLVIAMAAVPASEMPFDPNKETIGSLTVMRAILDQAQTVDEAVAILQSYNIAWNGGPALHYLIADRTGQAVLVEFYQGEMVLLFNDAPYHLATNHLRCTTTEGAAGCWRYDTLAARLQATNGSLDVNQALDLLAEVSAAGQTQWSVVYDNEAGAVHVVVGREYQNTYVFVLADYVGH